MLFKEAMMGVGRTLIIVVAIMIAASIIVYFFGARGECPSGKVAVLGDGSWICVEGKPL